MQDCVYFFSRQAMIMNIKSFKNPNGKSQNSFTSPTGQNLFKMGWQNIHIHYATGYSGEKAPSARITPRAKEPLM
eukprot:3721202-Karenia_brevis.AAC.1